MIYMKFDSSGGSEKWLGHGTVTLTSIPAIPA